MPNTKSAAKQVRVTASNRERNKAARSRVKTSLHRATKAISEQAPKEARSEVMSAVSALDKASEKGIIHPNKAARQKSRLMKKLNQVPPAKGK